MDETVSTLSRLIGQAGKAVLDSDIPDSFQAHAFERALDVLIAEAGLVRNPTPHPGALPNPMNPSSVVSQPGTQGGLDATPLGLIAARAGISEQEAKEVFRLDGDQLSLVVGNRKIDSNKATGAREITLLVAGARQAAELEEWTSLVRAREICSYYNRLDSSNYASTIKSMADAFNFHGQGPGREVRLTMPGWEQWSQLVQRLVRGRE